jgi:hypothetical protein
MVGRVVSIILNPAGLGMEFPNARTIAYGRTLFWNTSGFSRHGLGVSKNCVGHNCGFPTISLVHSEILSLGVPTLAGNACCSTK